MTQIRHGTLADIDDVLAMARRLCAGSAYQRGVAFNDARAKTIAERLTTDPDAVLLLAIRDNVLVGMLGLLAYGHLLSGERRCAEVCWWVDVPHRGGRVGLLLLEAAEQWARDHDVVALEMTAPITVYERVYERRGYRATGRMYERRVHECRG